MVRFSSTAIAALGVLAAVCALVVTVSAQTLPRTPWGDPDLQGTYTNSNESGIPMERPAEFAGKRLDEVQPADLARLMAQRAEQVRKTAAVIGGTTDNDTGAGPPHWYENYNPANSRAWMISIRRTAGCRRRRRRRSAAPPPCGPHAAAATATTSVRSISHRTCRCMSAASRVDCPAR